ncbi:RCC1-like domain-containing protein [Herbidospora mongoliensis]|uniref:RCC1-like domain-containing protein n=1 Tax=Herbidospora mongoliensis TaxID=688067 RepID=UPI00082B1347|nr:RCC1 domain-containing protein [Herbidospora mongoliensis]
MLARATDGTVWAWGDNTFRQLGDGTTTSRAVPRQVTGLTGVRTVSAGYRHNLVVTQAGQVYAWGDNTSGRLGDGTTTTRRTPVATPIIDVQQVDPGMGGTAAALTTGFYVMTWGDNTGNALGRNTANAFDPIAREVWADMPSNSISVGRSTGLATSNLLPNPPPRWMSVPDVIGLPEDSVPARLTAVRLRLGVRNIWVDRYCTKLGQVVGQSPSAHSSAAIDSEVDITVAVPPAGPCP